MSGLDVEWIVSAALWSAGLVGGWVCLPCCGKAPLAEADRSVARASLAAGG